MAGASLAEIGELAGFSRGLPAHLFGNKDRLLAECLRRMIDDYWLGDLPPVGAEGGFASLAAAIRKWIADLSLYPERTRAHALLLQEAHMADAGSKFPTLMETIRAHASSSERQFSAYIAAGLAAGEIDPGLDPAFEALIIHSTLRGVTLRWLLDPASIDVERFAEPYVARLAAYMVRAG